MYVYLQGNHFQQNNVLTSNNGHVLNKNVVNIQCPGSFGKDCFDILKSIGFGDLVRLFSSSRRSDRVYFG